MRVDDPLEFKRWVLIGGQVSAKHPIFQKLAMLGYEEAEIYSFFEWLKYIGNNPEISFEEGLLKLIELTGQAHFLPTLKELTRISMILGDTSKRVSYDE